MDVAGDEVNSASAVLVDGRDGNLVTQTERNLATGNSTVTPQHIAEKIVENLLLDGVDAERRHNIESITLHRRGDFGDEELHGMKNKIDELRGDGNLSEDVTVSAVEISENSIYRLYDNDEYVSETGSYARVDSDQIAVVTYGDPQIHQGTPNPILCTRKLGGTDLDTIGRDIFFLSFLDWGAPTSKIKRPITTHLPKEMHDILERGLSVRYPPF
jgi:argonaute-like protein implicated in RNA metabolism and viral defense